MKTNKIISYIVDEKKEFIRKYLPNKFLNIPKTGDIIHVDYEHVTAPLPKTRKVSFVKHQFFGLCTSVSKKNLNFIFKLRNVLKKKPVNVSFFLYSPLIENITKFPQLQKFHFRKSKLNFLTNKPIRYSKIRLDQN
jgi:ribosomal protein L19